MRAFQLADEMVILIYRLTLNFPREEIYGLCSQMRRAGVSVASNIVEGSSRRTEKEYYRFLEIAFGSLRELHYQFNLSICLGYIKIEEATVCRLKIEETEKVLFGLLLSLRKNQTPST